MKSLLTRIKITAIAAYFKVYTSSISKESESLMKMNAVKRQLTKRKPPIMVLLLSEIINSKAYSV